MTVLGRHVDVVKTHQRRKRLHIYVGKGKACTAIKAVGLP